MGIERAKYNVEAYYSIVGMAEDLKRSFQLLGKLREISLTASIVKLYNKFGF